MNISEVKKISSTDGNIRITFVGRLVYLKGVQCLLEALKSLIEDGNTQISCRIIGDGEDREKLEKFVQENKLES